MRSLLALADHWRERAASVREWAAAEGSARALEGCAAELEEAVRAALDEELTLEEASTASGYSKRRLRELVAAGELPNAGRKGAPRIRRADLPRKPGGQSESGYDVDADAAALVARLGMVR